MFILCILKFLILITINCETNLKLFIVHRKIFVGGLSWDTTHGMLDGVHLLK